MNIFTATLLAFIAIVFVIEMLFWAFSTLQNPEGSKIRKRLKKISYDVNKTDFQDIIRKTEAISIPSLNRIMLRISGIRRLNKLIIRANADFSAFFYISIAFGLAMTGYIACFIKTANILASAVVAILLWWSPFLYLSIKKDARLQKFQTQLPEALDLIARSLKAGHAFTSGMKLAADEFGDPLGPEFEESLNAINLGMGITDALKHLATRINSPDLKFFVIAVILQRETGGNLAEIIENIAQIIRERFKLMDKIRTLSAEGKLSAVILCALPFLVIGALLIVNTEYIMILFRDPVGKILFGIACIMMAFGVLVMRKIIDIDV